MFRVDNVEMGRKEALEQARTQLGAFDLVRAAEYGGLHVTPEGMISLEFLGRKMSLNPRTFSMEASDGNLIHIIEETLILRYLAIRQTIKPTGELISFRDLPGGTFYLQPIHDRTSTLVLRRFGNDLEGLRQAVSRYNPTFDGPGDLGATVPVIGRIDLTLVYRLGDEEFAPTFDILFDRIISSIYHLDEVAALAQRLCFGLIRYAAVAPDQVS